MGQRSNPPKWSDWLKNVASVASLLRAIVDLWKAVF